MGHTVPILPHELTLNIVLIVRVQSLDQVGQLVPNIRVVVLLLPRLTVRICCEHTLGSFDSVGLEARLHSQVIVQMNVRLLRVRDFDGDAVISSFGAIFISVIQ